MPDQNSSQVYFYLCRDGHQTLVVGINWEVHPSVLTSLHVSVHAIPVNVMSKENLEFKLKLLTNILLYLRLNESNFWNEK